MAASPPADRPGSSAAPEAVPSVASDGQPAQGSDVQDAPGPAPASDAGRPDVGPSEDRILTVPNLITLVRLACLPVFVWLLLGADNPAGAAALLAALGATDWVDGYVARHFHQVSTLGKVLDPVADRLLFFTAIVTIIVADGAPLWFCIAVLVREGVVAATTLVLAAMGARRIDVTWFGKAGTFGLMFAFPLFLAGTSTLYWADVATVLAWCCGIPGLVFSYYSAITYVPLATRALQEGRRGQTPSSPPPGGPPRS